MGMLWKVIALAGEYPRGGTDCLELACCIDEQSGPCIGRKQIRFINSRLIYCSKFTIGGPRRYLELRRSPCSTRVRNW